MTNQAAPEIVRLNAHKRTLDQVIGKLEEYARFTVLVTMDKSLPDLVRLNAQKRILDQVIESLEEYGRLTVEPASETRTSSAARGF